MYADTQPHQVSDEYEPAVGALVLTALFPLEDQPEDHRREERTEGIDLRLHCAEPEGIREGVDQATHKSRPEDSHGLSPCHHLADGIQTLLTEVRLRTEDTTHHVCDRPEEEEDRQTTEHCTRGIGQDGSTLWASPEVRDDIVDQHVEGGTGRVTDLQLVVTCDELRTVPEAC